MFFCWYAKEFILDIWTLFSMKKILLWHQGTIVDRKIAYNKPSTWSLGDRCMWAHVGFKKMQVCLIGTSYNCWCLALSTFVFVHV